MNNTYPPAVAQIVSDYLERVRSQLRGMNAADQEDLLREIQVHIQESYQEEPGSDDIQRILNVLRKFGEPAEVIAGRMSKIMVDLGKKKKLPMYILAGLFIALFGLPLGLSGAGLVISLVITLFGILIAYFATAVMLVFSGLVGMLISFINIVAPGFIDKINNMAGFQLIQLSIPLGHLHPLFSNPLVESILAFLICMAVAGAGLFMLWVGKFILRGLRFLLRLVGERLRNLTKRKPVQATL